MRKMSQAVGGAGPCTKKNTTGKGNRGKKHTWIWTAGGAPDEQANKGLHCCEREITYICSCGLIN
jgi:hypothetical protein